MLSFYGIHLIGWAFLILMSLTVGDNDPFQANCGPELPVALWSRVVGIVAIGFWVAMVLLWFLFLASMKRWRSEAGKPRVKLDVLQM